MNDAVAEYLDYYIDRAPPRRGAVLLTGPWGAGKTHFITSYLNRRAAARKKADPLNGPGHLLVSLNGVATTEEVSAQFFAQTNPVLGSGPARLLGTAATRAANALVRSQLFKSGDEKALRTLLGRDISQLTLVFDDLERCAMPILEIMGFINTFVEIEGAKVIVLASEADIPEKQRDDYLRRKEKLIAKTLVVRSEPTEVYRAWVREMRHEPAREAATDNEAAALRTFEASGVGNLRSLRAALEDFDRLTSVVDARLSSNPPALGRLLLYMLAAWLELRGDAIRPDTLAQLSKSRLRRLVAGVAGRGLTPVEQQSAEIAEKYADVDWSDSVVPTESLASLHASGVIDRDAIDARLAEHPLIAAPGDAPSWRQLWRWFQISPEEYKVVRQRFRKDLDAFAIAHPGPILHAAGLIVLLSKYGDDLLDGRPVENFFAAYIGELETRNLLVPALSVLEGLDETGYGGLAYTEPKSPDFAAVRDLLDAAVRRSLDKQLQADAPALLVALRTGENAYSSLYEWGRGDGRFGAVPILCHIAPADFAEACLESGRLNDRLLGALNARYAHDADGGVTIQEAPWINALMTELRSRAAAVTPPHERRLSKTLDYWSDELEATLLRGSFRNEERSKASQPDAEPAPDSTDQHAGPDPSHSDGGVP